jgi:PTS system N-acetylglucosamine-specific IIC component
MKECIYKYIQRMGRSLMLPVACLPAAALFVGIGNWIASFTGGDVVSTFLTTAGGTARLLWPVWSAS